MKSTVQPDAKRKPVEFIQLGESFTHAKKGKLRPTSIVLKTAMNARRQHLAIGKLVKMCKASPVVAIARRGITAEVRKDRDRGHD